MRAGVIALVVLGVTVTMSRAERPPQQRDEANAVVVGKILKITPKESAFGGDGVRTDYTAEVVVARVRKGEGVKVGDTIKVKWFRVTKNPSDPFPGAYGHSYKIKKDEQATFWLVGSGKMGWEVIYNSDGIEKLKK